MVTFFIYLINKAMGDFDTENYMKGLRLVANDAYFKSLAETLPHIMLVVDPDTFRIQYINRLRDGFTFENVIGKEVFDFVWPDYHDLYRQKIQEVIQDHQTKVFESVGQGSNGKTWYRTHISVLLQANGDTGSVMLIAEDITDSKLKEIEIFEKGEKLKAIINNTNDIICSIDLDYRLTEFNTVFAKMVKAGYNVELENGMEVLLFISPKKHDHLRAIYKRVANGETCNDVESFETPTRGIIFNETSYNPILNAENNVIGISIFSKDITERVKNEQQIKSALKEKEVLLAEIHHRIKNNLAMVSSLLQLQELTLSNKEAKEALSQSRKRIKSTALVHELLYKNEAFASICLKDYIKELFENLKINNEIKLVLNGDSATIDLATAMPLGLLLNEIMTNSFKHSYKAISKGKIDITIGVSDALLTMEYCDCVGSFPDTVDFKNANTTGLMLIQTFTEQLSGRIDLISKTPPKYRISVPLNG